MVNDTCTSEVDIRPGNDAPIGPSDFPRSNAFGDYIVYAIEELASGRTYVGLTRRPVRERIASHLAQSRRGGRTRAGGLMASLRLMHALGQRFAQCFSVRVLARARTVEEARTLEREWVERLDCRTPHGFNSMPGGSSVGGVDNAKSVTIVGRDGSPRTYPSIRTAVDEINSARARDGLARLEPGTIYSRVAGGWKLEEAFGLERRQRPQGIRQPFALGGGVYTSLRAASEATGLLPSTVRSRLQRAGQSIGDDMPQIGLDRRARGAGAIPRLHILWPQTEELLTAAEFAARTGLPKATVIHRWHQLRALVESGECPSSEEGHRFMLEPKRGPSSGNQRGGPPV